MLGYLFLSAVLAEKSPKALLDHGPVEHLFKASEMDAYDFVRGFVKQYQALPDPATVKLHTGEELPDAKEPAAYYRDLMEAQYIEVRLKQAMKSASDLLLPENKDPEAALAAVMEMAMQLAANKQAAKVVDFRHAHDLLVADYVAKWNAPDAGGLMMGWPTMDGMTGGLVTGDLASLVGLTGAGKTWMLLYAAMHGWKQAGASTETDQSRLFVSMEMGVLPIQQRLAAMFTHLPMNQVKQATLGTKNLKKLKDGLMEVQGFGAPFWVVDGNLTSTVEDIWALCRQLKPAACFIDGGYLVKHPTEKDRYRRVAENADLMKMELAPLCPTVVSWQFAKTASKKKKGEKVGLEDIGYSHAIAEVSSLVAALLQEDSVQTLLRRTVDIIKGRNGEVGQFDINWKFDSMDFDEVQQQDVSELQFL